MNRVFARLLLSALVGIAACSSHPKPESSDRAFNPKTEFWHSVGLQSNYLVEAGATKLEWLARADSAEPVKTPQELEELFTLYGLPYYQRGNATALFNHGFEAMHFGFWRKGQALVFFDHDEPKGVIRW